MNNPCRLFTYALVACCLAEASAVAATLVQSGSTATGINSLVVDGSTYNVVFGYTVDTTFSTSATALDAVAALVSALNKGTTDTTVSGGSYAFSVCYKQDSSSKCDAIEVGNQSNTGVGWVNSGALLSAPVDSDDPAADFTLVSASAPEPRTISSVAVGGLLLFAGLRTKSPSRRSRFHARTFIR